MKFLFRFTKPEYCIQSTEETVKAFFRNWCIDTRTDKCMSLREDAALSADEIAELNTTAFRNFLEKTNPL